MHLAEMGAMVVACGLEARQPGGTAQDGASATPSPSKRRDVVRTCSRSTLSLEADVDRVLAFASDRCGRLDGLVNDAAIHPRATLCETDNDLRHRVIGANLFGRSSRAAPRCCS